MLILMGFVALLAHEGRNVGYASRILNSTERKYSIMERGCLPFICVQKNFVRILINWSKGKGVYLITLTKLTDCKDVPERVVRWNFKLAEYNTDN